MTPGCNVYMHAQECIVRHVLDMHRDHLDFLRHNRTTVWCHRHTSSFHYHLRLLCSNNRST